SELGALDFAFYFTDSDTSFRSNIFNVVVHRFLLLRLDIDKRQIDGPEQAARAEFGKAALDSLPIVFDGFDTIINVGDILEVVEQIGESQDSRAKNVMAFVVVV